MERKVPFLMSRHPFPCCPNSLTRWLTALYLLLKRKRMPALLKLLLIVKLKLQLGVKRQNRCINHLLMATFISTGDQVWLVPSKLLANPGLQLTTIRHQPSSQGKERAKANNLHSPQHPPPLPVRVITVSSL